MLKKISACVPRDRDIVLVGHGFAGDRNAFNSLGFDRLQTSTFNIAQDLGIGHLPLRHLLEMLSYLSFEAIIRL